jgi:hypothetical protein
MVAPILPVVAFGFVLRVESDTIVDNSARPEPTVDLTGDNDHCCS